MEIARIRILPEFEIEKRQDFQNREHRCAECGGGLKLEFTLDGNLEAPLLLEEASCEACPAPMRKRVFPVQ